MKRIIKYIKELFRDKTDDRVKRVIDLHPYGHWVPFKDNVVMKKPYEGERGELFRLKPKSEAKK